MINKKIFSSKYNLFFNIDDNYTILFNTLTFNSIKFPLQETKSFELLNKIKNDCLDELEDPLKKILIEKEIVTKNQNNQVSEVFKEEEELIITISPTFSCNLFCKYCFENSTEFLTSGCDSKEKTSFFNQKKIYEIINKIIDYNKTKIIKTIRINWFGGEPLLYYKEIILFMESLKKVLSETHKIKMKILSNGYLLDDRMIKELKKNNLKIFHITLDGDEKFHDKLKKLKNNEGTFLKIFSNLKLLINNEIKTAVRINVDKKNFSSIFKLIDKLSNLNNSQYINVEFRNIFWNGSKNYSKDDCISDEEFYKIKRKLIEYSALKGIKSKILIQNLPNYCTATKKNTIVIDPYGNLGKCWFEKGENSKNESFHDYLLNNRFISYDSQIKKYCNNCLIYGICGGGCPKNNNFDELICKKKKKEALEDIKLYLKINKFI